MTAAVAALQLTEVRELHSAEECAACEPLYREVFDLGPDEGSLNARLLVSLSRNSGIVIGGYSAGSLAGFAVSFLARDEQSGRLYQYSQTAAVAPAWQRRGIGRALKFGQRAGCLSRGIDLVRWTFDPLRPANAHFNLDVLGAVVTGLARDFYGITAVPADRDDPTDRFTVDWELRSEAVAARAAAAAHRTATICPAPSPRLIAPVLPGELRTQEGRVLLGVPADWRWLRSHRPARAAGLRRRIIGQAEELLASGMVGVSCTQTAAGTAVYEFASR